MRFEYENDELDIMEETTEDSEQEPEYIFNYCKTLAGHTLMVNPKYEIVPGPMPGTYLLKERKS